MVVPELDNVKPSILTIPLFYIRMKLYRSILVLIYCTYEQLTVSKVTLYLHRLASDLRIESTQVYMFRISKAS